MYVTPQMRVGEGWAPVGLSGPQWALINPSAGRDKEGALRLAIRLLDSDSVSDVDLSRGTARLQRGE